MFKLNCLNSEKHVNLFLCLLSADSSECVGEPVTSVEVLPSIHLCHNPTAAAQHILTSAQVGFHDNTIFNNAVWTIYSSVADRLILSNMTLTSTQCAVERPQPKDCVYMSNT